MKKKTEINIPITLARLPLHLLIAQNIAGGFGIDSTGEIVFREEIRLPLEQSDSHVFVRRQGGQ